MTLTGLTLDERGRMGVRGQQYVRQHHLDSDLAQRFLQQVWSSSRQ